MLQKLAYMAEKIDFFQIFWDDEQQRQFFPWAIPLYNPTLTVFFENAPISHAVLASIAEKIAVCSYNLKNKYHKFSIPPHGDLTKEVLQSDYDVLSFTKNSPSHQMLAAMDEWHKGSKLILSTICSAIGMKLPKECKYPIYQNAFCATSKVYKEYVSTCLVPAMEVMELDVDIKAMCWTDSNYYRLQKPTDSFAKRVKQFLGVDFCPMHTFLLERLFSVWINDKGLNVKYL